MEYKEQSLSTRMITVPLAVSTTTSSPGFAEEAFFVDVKTLLGKPSVRSVRKDSVGLQDTIIDRINEMFHENGSVWGR